MRFVGIDVSVGRGLDVAVLGPDKQLQLLLRLSGPRWLGPFLDELGRELLIGVDAPRGLALRPGGRLAERELLRRRISLYTTPDARGALPTWMQSGFAVWEAIRAAGFRELRRVAEANSGALEVYPHLAYVCWAGRGRPNTQAPVAWATEAVRGRGIPLEGVVTKDQADAVAAALVAAAYAAGRAVPVGDPAEGIIWAPGPVPDLRTGEHLRRQ